MVMGTITAGSGGGAGVPGPPGPPGAFDPLVVALGVTARALFPPGPLPDPGDWETLNFSFPELDTHGALQPGPTWRFVCPIRGVYLLLAQLLVRPEGPQGSFSLRVVRGGTTEVSQQTFIQPDGILQPRGVQMTALVILEIGETVHLEFRNHGPAPVQSLTNPNSFLVIQGVGRGRDRIHAAPSQGRLLRPRPGPACGRRRRAQGPLSLRRLRAPAGADLDEAPQGSVATRPAAIGPYRAPAAAPVLCLGPTQPLGGHRAGGAQSEAGRCALAMEYGGDAVLVRGGRARRVRYAPRPFMQPAFAAEQQSLPPRWRNSIR